MALPPRPKLERRLVTHVRSPALGPRDAGERSPAQGRLPGARRGAVPPTSGYRSGASVPLPRARAGARPPRPIQIDGLTLPASEGLRRPSDGSVRPAPPHQRVPSCRPGGGYRGRGSSPPSPRSPPGGSFPSETETNRLPQRPDTRRPSAATRDARRRRVPPGDRVPRASVPQGPAAGPPETHGFSKPPAARLTLRRGRRSGPRGGEEEERPRGILPSRSCDGPAGESLNRRVPVWSGCS